MNIFKKRFRISDRKFNINDIATDKTEAAEIKSRINKVMSKLNDANIPIDEYYAAWIVMEADKFNLYNAVDIYDDCERYVYKSYNGKYMLISMKMEGGTHTISVIYEDKVLEDKCVNTELENCDFLYTTQMAYDIYIGLPKIDCNRDFIVKVRNTIDMINEAKTGDIFRRDIFSCYNGHSFIPMDILNVKITIDGKLKDIPLITGFLDGKPYTIITSIWGVSPYYRTESAVISGKDISLKNNDNLYIQLIKDMQENKRSPKRILRNAVNLVTDLRARNVSTLNTELKAAYSFMSFIDDEERSEQQGLDILPELLKQTTA